MSKHYCTNSHWGDFCKTLGIKDMFNYKERELWTWAFHSSQVRRETKFSQLKCPWQRWWRNVPWPGWFRNVLDSFNYSPWTWFKEWWLWDFSKFCNSLDKCSTFSSPSCRASWIITSHQTPSRGFSKSDFPNHDPWTPHFKHLGYLLKIHILGPFPNPVMW